MFKQRLKITIKYKNIQKLLLLVILIVVSFSARLIYLDKTPEGFHRDEVAFGYNAYSISKTGKDEFGRFFPFLFESYGDYKLPVVVYLTAPVVAIFGLTDFWVRFPTALAGALTPIVLYFLMKNLTKNEWVPPVAAFSLAIMPQHILFSRSVNESTVSILFFLLGTTFLIKLMKSWQLNSLLLAIIFLTISLFTYRTQFIFEPIIISIILITFSKSIKKWPKRQRTISVLGALTFVTLLFIVIAKTSSTRLRDVSFLTDSNLKQSLAIQIRENGAQNTFVTRAFHNKLIIYTTGFVQKYVSHFDLTYLFFTGDKLSSNNSTPWMGHLLYIDLPFFIIGIICLLKFKTKEEKLPLYWLLVGPIASAATVDSPSAVRNLISTISYSTIIAYGITFVIHAAPPPKKNQIRFSLCPSCHLHRKLSLFRPSIHS